MAFQDFSISRNPLVLTRFLLQHDLIQA